VQVDAHRTEIERTFREEYGRAVSVLVRAFGDIELAEDGVQDAFTIAATRWADEGVPPSPAGWIITTARHRIIDRLRRESSRDGRQTQAALLHHSGEFDADESDEELAVKDDRLRLIFTCCHPALAPPVRVALTLRLLGGLTTPEIARAFLVSEPTMSQRISRAKAKIKGAGIPYRVPSGAELPDRLAAVLAVVYLVFNEGYTVTSGDELARDDLCQEAVRLGRVLLDLMPDEPEVMGLVALMLLVAARRPARTRPDGSLVVLREQDRTLWDGAMVAEGLGLVRACLRRNRPGRYQLQAAINAVHGDAGSAEMTDWHQILALYDQLALLDRSPIVALNRAVAVAEVEGPESALRCLAESPLQDYYLLHAVQADLLSRLGRFREAEAEYEVALGLTDNGAERAFLEQSQARVASR
jgi:RNA polymerase sigma-70 factor, ECF subfamily